MSKAGFLAALVSAIEQDRKRDEVGTKTKQDVENLRARFDAFQRAKALPVHAIGTVCRANPLGRLVGDSLYIVAEHAPPGQNFCSDHDHFHRFDVGIIPTGARHFCVQWVESTDLIPLTDEELAALPDESLPDE